MHTKLFHILPCATSSKSLNEDETKTWWIVGLNGAPLSDVCHNNQQHQPTKVKCCFQTTLLTPTPPFRGQYLQLKNKAMFNSFIKVQQLELMVDV